MATIGRRAPQPPAPQPQPPAPQPQPQQPPATSPQPQPAAAVRKVTECGADYTRKVKGGEQKPYKCTKDKGHDGDHGQKRPEPLDTSSITLDMLDTFEPVPGDEIVAVREEDANRSELQQRVDKQVKSAHESWVIAGKPKGFNDSPRQRYKLPNRDEAKKVMVMLRKAEKFVGVHIRFAPLQTHVDGSTMLVWVATDKAPRRKNGEGKEETAKAEAPVQEPVTAS